MHTTQNWGFCNNKQAIKKGNYCSSNYQTDTREIQTTRVITDSNPSKTLATPGMCVRVLYKHEYVCVLIIISIKSLLGARKSDSCLSLPGWPSTRGEGLKWTGVFTSGRHRAWWAFLFSAIIRPTHSHAYCTHTVGKVCWLQTLNISQTSEFYILALHRTGWCNLLLWTWRTDQP